MRAVLFGVGYVCLCAGLFPSGHGYAHPARDGTMCEFFLGLPSSPVFRSYRKVIESPHSPTIDEEGHHVEPSWSSSTACGWGLNAPSWSAALALVGAAMLVLSLRGRPRELAKESGATGAERPRP